jgi:hypothetical protein
MRLTILLQSLGKLSVKGLSEIIDGDKETIKLDESKEASTVNYLIQF